MWKLLTYSDHGVKWDEDLHVRWNFVNGHKYEELEDEEIVMWHYFVFQANNHDRTAALCAGARKRACPKCLFKFAKECLF